MGDSVTACCKSNNAGVPFPSAGHHAPAPSSPPAEALSTSRLILPSSASTVAAFRRERVRAKLATQSDEPPHCHGDKTKVAPA